MTLLEALRVLQRRIGLVKTAKAQLVTIVLPFGAGDRLTRDLKELGVSGYTTIHVNGFGTTGGRTYGLIEGANLRLETIVTSDLCDRIMEHLGSHYGGESLVAHYHEVNAIPVAHFSPK